MSELKVNASVLAAPYPFGGTFPQFDLVISVTDSAGIPVTGLLESQIQIVLVWEGGRVINPAIGYSKQIPVLDQNGDPITQQQIDEFGNVVDVPMTTFVPGPARTLGLPGYYQMTLIKSPASWPVGRIAAEIAVTNGGDAGQTLLPIDILLPF